MEQFFLIFWYTWMGIFMGNWSADGKKAFKGLVNILLWIVLLGFTFWIVVGDFYTRPIGHVLVYLFLMVQGFLVAYFVTKWFKAKYKPQ